MILIIAFIVGALTSAVWGWREWRDIHRTRKWLREGKRILAQFALLNTYRVRYLDPCISRYSTMMTDEERTKLDADIAWWFASSDETQRQADSWRAAKPSD